MFLEETATVSSGDGEDDDFAAGSAVLERLVPVGDAGSGNGRG